MASVPPVDYLAVFGAIIKHLATGASLEQGLRIDFGALKTL
jgi:hypothetical protein